MENHFNMLRLGITNEAYHADPALNRSRADDLLTMCPLKVKYAMEQPRKSSPPLLNGGHVHSGVLEPHLTDSEYGCKPTVIDGNSSRTKAYKEAFAEMEEANPGKRWIVESDYYNNQEVIASVLQTYPDVVTRQFCDKPLTAKCLRLQNRPLARERV